MDYFTSDLHIGHNSILEYCNRPFENIEHHDELLIKNINDTCGKDDTLYILGDFVFMRDKRKLYDVHGAIAAQVVLIFGNHDHKKTRKADCFQWSGYYKELKGEYHMILQHYPLLLWNRSKHGSFMLHGHCHGELDGYNKSYYRLDVGVDSHGFKPWSKKEIIEEMEARDPIKPDHHNFNP